MKKRKKMKENNKEEEKIVESFLGGMPVFGNFFKELAKTETFKEKFREVNEKIEENLRKGAEKKWGFEASVNIRPILKEAKEDASEIAIKEDYFYGRKGNKLTLAVKAPGEKTDLKIRGKNLLITAENFEKKIELPDYFRKIEKKNYKNGILMLELEK